MRSLYIHVPFCAKKCDYCDFASYADKNALIDDYFGALNGELDGVIEKYGNEFATAFIGGGTPSFVNEKYIVALADRICTGEFTIEANPGTVTVEKLRAYRASGINRVSFGVQSFDDSLLRGIGRIHNGRQALEAVSMAKSAGFENINIDLMYALPSQSMEAWRETLSTAVNTGVTHISAYSLIIEEGTPISKRFDGLDDDIVNDMQRAATRILAENGFERYEISNYAKEGCECEHNLRYWTRGDYIGIGSAAHSLVDGRRFANPALVEEYIISARHIDEEILSPEDIREEEIMLGLRTKYGISADGLDESKVKRLVEAGYAQLDGGQFILTERGMEIMDSVAVELIYN